MISYIKDSNALTDKLTELVKNISTQENENKEYKSENDENNILEEDYEEE